MTKANRLKFIFIITLTLAFNTVLAQFNSAKFDDIQKLREVPLLVVLESANPKILKKLERKGAEKLENYLAEIEGKNRVIKSAIEDTWTISKDIKFIGSEALKNYNTKENKGKYAYITSEVYDKARSKNSKSGYVAYCNYSIFILGDLTPLHSVRYGSEYSITVLNKKDVELVWNEMQSHFKHKEEIVAERRAKRELRKNSSLAKSSFSDED